MLIPPHLGKTKCCPQSIHDGFLLMVTSNIKVVSISTKLMECAEPWPASSALDKIAASATPVGEVMGR
jgi:hypothetical protein